MDQDAGCVSHPRTSRLKAIVSLASSGGIMCIGGPALIYYVTPTEEELFKVSSLLFAPVVVTDLSTSATTPNYSDDLSKTVKESKRTSTTS